MSEAEFLVHSVTGWPSELSIIGTVMKGEVGLGSLFTVVVKDHACSECENQRPVKILVQSITAFKRSLSLLPRGWSGCLGVSGMDFREIENSDLLICPDLGLGHGAGPP